jgi:prepilin-type N-terminal cleavage/methylation domain-containing protein
MIQTRQRHNSGNRGITLVELLVVISIIALLSSLSIPLFITMGGYARDDEKSARELTNLIRFARTHASTHRVRTAVVYSLDNYSTADNTIATPIFDSVTGEQVRVIDAAAVFYELPRTDPNAGTWVRLPGVEGEFRRFSGDIVLLMKDVSGREADPLRPLEIQTVYASDQARFNPAQGQELWRLGMENELSVCMADDLPCPPQSQAFFPAHVFSVRGSLQVPVPPGGGPAPERYTVHMGPMPDLHRADRLYDAEHGFIRTDDNRLNLITVPIDLFRSTGRVQLAKE